jgi:hypothetical protein
LAVPAEIRSQSEIGFLAIYCAEAVATGMRPVISHAFAQDGPQCCGYRTKYSREDWRAMILANRSVLRLRLEKQRAKSVPARFPVTTPVMIVLPQAQVRFAAPPGFS